jgi:hypothetical protein
MLRTVGVTLAVVLAFGALGLAAMASGLVGARHRAGVPHPAPNGPVVTVAPAATLPPEHNPPWTPSSPLPGRGSRSPPSRSARG